MKTNDFLSKLTIICLTYERQSYVRRQLAYFSKFPIKIIFADGSSEQLGINPQGKIELLAWRYIHIPGAATSPQRFSTALEFVDTDYVCMMDDADVLFASGLELAVRELEKNSHLIFAGGKVTCFESNGSFLNFTKWGHWTDSFEITSDDPGERLLSMIKSMRTGNVSYVVAKTLDFKNIAVKITNVKFAYNAASELVIAGLLAIKSQYKIGEYPFWMRGDEPSIDPNLYAKMPRTVWDSKCPDELQYVKETLAEALVNQGYTSDAALLTVEKYLEIHYQQSFKQEELSEKFKSNSSFRSILQIFSLLFWKLIISKKLGKKAYLLIKPYRQLKMFLSGKHGDLPSDFLEFWRRQCGELSDEQMSDLLDIYQILKKFPKGIPSNEIMFQCIEKVNL